jgi:hypothetical protein
MQLRQLQRRCPHSRAVVCYSHPYGRTPAAIWRTDGVPAAPTSSSTVAPSAQGRRCPQPPNATRIPAATHLPALPRILLEVWDSARVAIKWLERPNCGEP